MADVLDSDYVIDTESLKNNIEDGITFLGTEGTKRTKIVLDPSTDRWTVIDKEGDKIMYLDDQTNLPTGLYDWVLDKPYCDDERTERDLFINYCQSDSEFACHDGGCLGTRQTMKYSKITQMTRSRSSVSQSPEIDQTQKSVLMRIAIVSGSSPVPLPSPLHCFRACQ